MLMPVRQQNQERQSAARQLHAGNAPGDGVVADPLDKQ